MLMGSPSLFKSIEAAKKVAEGYAEEENVKWMLVLWRNYDGKPVFKPIRESDCSYVLEGGWELTE